MKVNIKNKFAYVENRVDADGFKIYLYFSGQREYLMSHHNGLLYALLKGGVA